jgi:hypothetical protein
MSSPPGRGSTAERATADLGAVDPARSRHAGRRSAVALPDSAVVVGTAAGEVRAFDRPEPGTSGSSVSGARPSGPVVSESEGLDPGTDRYEPARALDERWRAASPVDDTAVVAAVPFTDGVAVGERGPEGGVACYDLRTGERRWRYAAADDVGDPTKRSRFQLPYVVDLATGTVPVEDGEWNDGEEPRLYAAARRYERGGDGRAFASAIYAFDANGGVVWRRETDASPVSLDVRGGRLGVAYNRCPGDHQHGLVVHDATSGAVESRWDPDTDGERRVGDVALLDDGAAVTSHADYRGYRLDADGNERWAVDLATPTDVDGETLYAYPNHVHATADAAVFVTGNTYSTDGRETSSLHPDEHTAFGVTPSGDRRWRDPVGGFAGEIAVDDRALAVPVAQHFRERDAGVHGIVGFDATAGRRRTIDTHGIVTAVARDGRTVAAVEEPIVYHDDGTERGDYRLRLNRGVSRA